MFKFCRFLMPAKTMRVNPARMAMMAMTTSSSISVKAARFPPAAFRFSISFMFFILAFFQFLFHAFAQPLLDHALVIQKPHPGEPLDARQHPRVNPQRDGHGLGRLDRKSTR